MRRLRYSVAASLDGFIAGPNSEYDWIVMDPEIDFSALMTEFDAIFMGRKTFEVTQQQAAASGSGSGGGGGGDENGMFGMQVFVFSSTLRDEEFPSVTVVTDPRATLVELRKKPGKDIWLFGGGNLFGSCLEQGLVDAVEIAVMPVVLGAGLPLLATACRSRLRLENHRVYKKTGTVSLTYAVVK